MRVFASTLFFLSYFLLFSQSNQAEYLEAKRQFSLSNYAAARQSFESLVDDSVFGEYASFYYGLSLFQLDQKKAAYDMFKQIQLKYPDWNQKEEVTFWLAYIAFDQAKYYEAFKHAELLPEELQQSLIEHSFTGMTVEELESAYALNQDNQHIGTYLARALMNLPFGQRDQLLLQELFSKFDLSTLRQDVSLPLIKKDKYAVAAVLPFMFDSLGNPQSVIRNSIIFDMYMGMLLAQDQLKAEGIAVEVLPFDTKKKAAEAKKMISEGALVNADVIVGPLYGGPSEVISAYSREQNMTMINPLSSNGEVIGENPYSYLFKPSYATQGREAAAYAANTFTQNKKVFIFYETDRDSVVANAYKDAIQLDSFFVVRFERITNESAQQVQKDFIEQYEVRLDTLYSREEMDSIAMIAGRFVKTRPLRDEKSGRILKKDGEDVLEYYENRFTVKEDSIGHIFAATSSNLLANNFISLAEVRSDTIGIIGYEDWLDFSLVAYDQLERLGVSFVSPGYYDIENSVYESVVERFIEKVGREPGEYHIIGYELMMQLGRLLDQHGKYFQRGLIDGEMIPGILMKGMRYGPNNDNQVVPLTKLEDLRLVEQRTK